MQCGGGIDKFGVSKFGKTKRRISLFCREKKKIIVLAKNYFQSSLNGNSRR